MGTHVCKRWLPPCKCEHAVTLHQCCRGELPRLHDSVGKCFHNEGIIVQWQSVLHGEPSTLAAGAEQNSGHKCELSQQQVKYTQLILACLVQHIQYFLHTLHWGLDYSNYVSRGNPVRMIKYIKYDTIPLDIV